MRLLLAASALALIATSPASAQSAASGDKAKSLDAMHSEAMIEQAKTGYADAPVDERLVTTHHSVAVGGRVLKYTANAGTLTIRDVAGKPRASMQLHPPDAHYPEPGQPDEMPPVAEPSKTEEEELPPEKRPLP